MGLTSSAGVSAPLTQSLTNGGWEWEIAQPPCPTGAYAEEMFYTVPEGISSLPQSNMTYELSFRVLHTHLLTLLPATTSKTNSMHPNLYLRLCIGDNTCFVWGMLLSTSGTAMLVCIFKSPQCHMSIYTQTFCFLSLLASILCSLHSQYLFKRQCCGPCSSFCLEVPALMPFSMPLLPSLPQTKNHSLLN